MKRRKFFTILFIAGSSLIGLWAAPARANTVHADVDMKNIRWTVGPGSTFNWISEWELLASASCFDSVNGFAGDSQTAEGQPATASAGANSGYSAADAQVSVDGSGAPWDLHASMDLTFDLGVSFASAFSTAMGYREFIISGGSGPVDATFGYDYVAHLVGDMPGWGADYRAVLSLSDGATTYDLNAYHLLMDPMNATFTETLSRTFTLQYETPYSITLSVDPDSKTPEGGPGMLFTWLALIFPCLLMFGRKTGQRSGDFVRRNLLTQNMARKGVLPRNLKLGDKCL
jgi:hypothetical protein